MFLHREQAKNMTNSQSDQGFKPKSVAYWQPTLTIDITITVLLWLTFRGDRVACDVNHRRKWQPAKNSDTVIATFAGGHSSAVKIKKNTKSESHVTSCWIWVWHFGFYRYTNTHSKFKGYWIALGLGFSINRSWKWQKPPKQLADIFTPVRFCWYLQIFDTQI